jgi:hypothetical protein
MFKFLGTYFFTLFTLMTFAQSADNFEISGTVISSYTDEPISGAAIVYSGQEAVLTDSLGHFIIHGLSKGQYKLAFTALGFDNHDTTINIDNTNVDISKWVITTSCPDFNVDKASRDIKEHEAKLLLYGSIAPSTGQADKKFKKKFGVTYVIFGDDETTREECKKIYNRVVFNYLDKKFGDKWRKEVRQDVVGLNDK